MTDINFRLCRPKDVEQAVPLIYSSGPAAFNYVFCDRFEKQSIEFLRSAFVLGKSEFGYQQHTAAIVEGEVVGIGAVRRWEQNLKLSIAAISKILHFYTPLAALRVISRGLKVERIIQPPQKNIGKIYHLAVSPVFQGKGIGRRLMEELQNKLIKQDINTFALDVAETNPRAKMLYKKLGYMDKVIHNSKLNSRFGRVVDHTYMERLETEACL